MLHVFFFKFSVLGDEVSKNIEACHLREANDKYRKLLVEFLQDQLADDFLAHTIDCMIFVKQTNFVLVRSDEFGKKISHWSWFGHDQMNARIYWCNKLQAPVGVKYGGLCR